MRFATYSIGLTLVLGLLGCSSTAPSPATSTTASASNACGGFVRDVANASSLSSPFEVVSVEPITRRVGRVETGSVVGARIAVVADPTLSRPGANRLLSCRMEAAHPTDPLAVPGTSVAVRDTSHGYVIEVTSARPSTGRIVLERAEALTTR